MKRKRIFFLTTMAILLASVILTITVSLNTKTKVKELFRMNKSLQEEGYCMAEFEFKVMEIVYNLDKGRYDKALSGLRKYSHQLKNKENLIKMPVFKSKQEEFEFFLNLQNPKTGAFIDDASPSYLYYEITDNILEHLDALAKELNVPLKLKYPLSYLDEINTPEKLYAFLNDVSNIGWLVAKFPQTPYFFARGVFSYINDDGIIAKNNLYNFSPEFKQAMMQWFYTSQDSVTGFWGPKSRKSGKLVKLDLDNTAPIVKKFRDKNGQDIYKDFPLRYEQNLIKTSLKVLSNPAPSDDELDEVHGWNLVMDKGIAMILRYLWNDMSYEDKQKTKSIIEGYIKIKFEKYYVSEEGAFSYYPGAKHASLDGTGSFIYKDLGALSSKKQKHLWGDYSKIITDLGQHKKTYLIEDDIYLLASHPGLNSIRIYQRVPNYDNLTDSVCMVGYPRKTNVLDITELYPKINKWINTHSNSVGNWKSKAGMLHEYSSFENKEPLIFREVIPIESLNNLFFKNHGLCIIGFDVLQIPRCKIEFKMDKTIM